MLGTLCILLLQGVAPFESGAFALLRSDLVLIEFGWGDLRVGLGDLVEVHGDRVLAVDLWLILGLIIVDGECSCLAILCHLMSRVVIHLVVVMIVWMLIHHVA